MLSGALETVLALAHNEAVHRRHAHLTLEHLLFAAANHPAGEEILRACAVDLERLRADLARYLDESVERLPAGSSGEPTQTLAFRRVLQAALLRVQSAQREEAQVGDVLAALLQQTKSSAAAALLLTPRGLEEKAVVTARFLRLKLDEYETLKRELDELQREAGETAQRLQHTDGK